MKYDGIADLTGSRSTFFHYVGVCNRDFRPLTPSLYLYRKIYERHLSVDYRVSELLPDQEFLDLMYVTLQAWNMDARKAKLEPIEKFSSSIRSFGDLIRDLSTKNLDALTPLEFSSALKNAKRLFVGLAVMESEARIVGVSKTLHFLLPKLFAPIDRTYTMPFFYGHSVYSKEAEKEFGWFCEVALECYRICHKLNLQRRDADGLVWNTTIPKIIDNAVIGYVQEHQ